MTERVNLVIHHGGKWQSMDTMVYKGGEVTYYDNIDIDYLSMFEMLGYTKELRYKDGGQMWFKIAGLTGLKSYEEILSDMNVANMLDYNKGMGDIEVYFVEEGLSIDEFDSFEASEFYAADRGENSEMGQTVKTGHSWSEDSMGSDYEPVEELSEDLHDNDFNCSEAS